MVTILQLNRFGMTGFAGWAVVSETPKLLLSRNTLSTEEQVKIGQILIGLSVLPLLAGAATAAQPTLLSDTQMDKVTAGDNELPAGFVTSTIQITTARGFIPVQIKYAIFPVCDTCSPTAALANAALAALLPPILKSKTPPGFFMNKLLMGWVALSFLGGTAVAGQPLTNQQMDRVTAGFTAVSQADAEGLAGKSGIVLTTTATLAEVVPFATATLGEASSTLFEIGISIAVFDCDQPFYLGGNPGLDR